MSTIDPRAFEFALSQINDGNIFERFAQDLLCQVLGYNFNPIGGIKDRGIDGLDRCYEIHNLSDTIYQISIEKDIEGKTRRTLSTLQENDVQCQRFFYVTNQTVKNQDVLSDTFFREFRISVGFRDLAWLRGQANHNEGTIKTYLAFVETYCHQFTKPSQTLAVEDLHTDPRIFVFLRQQWEERDEKMRLDELLADTLILYSLEGTDPDKGILRTKDEILRRAAQLVEFSLGLLEPIIDARLHQLSSKPNRKIRHHQKEDLYCLPYLTRLEVEQKHLEDAALHETFFIEAKAKLKKNLKASSVRVKDATHLLNTVFNNLFKQQGLEFSNFVVESSSMQSIEKSLPDIISKTVDDSLIISRNRTLVKKALLSTVREIIYKGSAEEMEYLRRLSSSYMMLFLLQCDPKVSVYFSTMAGKLRVLVGNSILVPALSELPLARRHRRHWNLLVKARSTGVTLHINRATLQELLMHIMQVCRTYKDLYQGREEVFNDEIAIMYVDEILIRSFLYGRLNKSIETFDEFIDQFITIESPNAERDLLLWLKGNFGIELLDEQNEGIQINEDDLELLTGELSKRKSPRLAENDAKTILSIFALRKLNKELEASSIFGYQTWWLSKDTITQRVVSELLGDKYPTSAYMRADFLNNYIALSPNFEDINRTFDAMFPTMVGVSISNHIPVEITKAVQVGIQDHASKNPARVSAIIANLSDRLKTDDIVNTKPIIHYLDERFTQLTSTSE